MQPKKPKNTDKYEWTTHSAYKMAEYGLSTQRIIRIIRHPERTEEGIVKNTIAVMQPTSISVKNGKKTWTSEIWAMYKIKKNKDLKKKMLLSKSQLKIISAWRYPGVSPKNNPIPEEIIRELMGVE